MTKYLYLIWMLWVCIACVLGACKQPNATTTIPARTAAQIVGLAKPILMQGDTTAVHLADVFAFPQKIDSVTSPDIKLILDKNKGELRLLATANTPPLSVVRCWSGGQPDDLVCKRSTKRPITITFKRSKAAKEVYIVGDLNNWNPKTHPLTLTGDTWSISLPLSPGRYPYQLIVDGTWMLDPANTQKVSNGIGGFNSLLEVPKPLLSELPNLRTSSCKNEQITLDVARAERVIALWNNTQIPVQYTSGSNRVQVQIPAAGNNLAGRSHIRLYAYNQKGIANDVLIPIQGSRVLTDAQQLNRTDLHSNIMYFVLIDRFNNAIKNNDKPVHDSKLTAKENYQGGDLAGVTAKLNDGYFKSLGVNSIWISPITLNPDSAYQEYIEPRRWFSGYHGYWPIATTVLDHRYGTPDELKTLVSTAHNKNTNILLDFVGNHIHKNHPIYKQHPDWATPWILPDGRKNIRLWDEQRLTTWFDDFLPTLDLAKKEVIEMQSDSALYWIQQYGIDGFRHDATKHVPTVFWQALTRKLLDKVMLPENRYVYQLGETYGSRELINSYIATGLLDAQFDFNLHFDARDIFAKDDGKLSALAQSLQESLDWFGYHHLMGNITGNHDQPRFMALASGALRFDEDAKAAGYARKIEVKDLDAYNKFKAMQAFVLTIPGIPVIQYGDEIGMCGAGDPDNRRFMQFEGLDSLQTDLLNTVRQISQMRAQRMSLLYGDTRILRSDDDVLAYERSYFGETTIVVFSKRKGQTIHVPQPAVSKIKATWGNATVTQQGDGVDIIIGADSFDVLTCER
jgi:cyclomaltodextrinase